LGNQVVQAQSIGNGLYEHSEKPGFCEKPGFLFVAASPNESATADYEDENEDDHDLEREVRWIISKEMSTGVTPLTREAWPRVKGRDWESLVRASLERSWTVL